MSLAHTTKDFDKAVRKVRADYANVANVDATASDVKEGATFLNASKQLVTGTLAEGSVTPNAAVSGSVLGSSANNYAIAVTPRVEVNSAGVITSVPDGTAVTKYIKTQSKTVTPKETAQEVTPTSGKLLESVTVNAAALPAVLENYGIFKCEITRPTVVSSSGYRAYIASGLSHTNISTSDLTNARLYLFRIGSSLSATNTINIIDPTTKDIPSTTIVLKPGESVTVTANTYSPGGKLELTSAGVVKMTYTSAFYCASTSYYTAPPFLPYINGYYYVAAVDAQIFTYNSTGIGSYASTSSGFYSGDIDIVAPTSTSQFVSYGAPEFVFHRFGWLTYYFYWKSTSSYTKLYMYFAKSISFLREGGSE